MRRRAFTLVELLVAVAVITVLLGLMLPALARSRDAARTAACLSNMRQVFMVCRMYANESNGLGPAIGQPYAALPNWALIVQSWSERAGRTAAELFTTESVLVCPSAEAHYARGMTRTCAMNATGHAGAPGDPDNYDAPGTTAHINFDRVNRPSEFALIVDAAAAPIIGDAPPPTRTASVIDFRSASHVSLRLGRWHGVRAGAGPFSASMFDGSARLHEHIPESWATALP